MKRLSRSMCLGMVATCLVIAGCPPGSKTVPNVVGQTQAAATTAITGAGLTVGTITQEYSETTPVGQVVSQNPTAGVGLLPGSPVSLLLSAAEETIMLPGEVPLEMVWIPGGTFTMGSPAAEADRNIDEGPQHSVTLNGFWTGKYQLTKRQWTAVMGTSPWILHVNVIGDGESPAVFVSWNNAQDFIDALNVLTGQTFRLPSEAEWEYACRAGTTTRFYWGDDPAYTVINGYAWWSGNTGPAAEAWAHLVGQKRPNGWGLYDMSGNVWEWCQDFYSSDYSGAPTDGSAWEFPGGSDRVLRGGFWNGTAAFCRSAARLGGDPEALAGSNYGFRLAR